MSLYNVALHVYCIQQRCTSDLRRFFSKHFFLREIKVFSNLSDRQLHSFLYVLSVSPVK